MNTIKITKMHGCGNDFVFMSSVRSLLILWAGDIDPRLNEMSGMTVWKYGEGSLWYLIRIIVQFPYRTL